MLIFLDILPYLFEQVGGNRPGDPLVLDLACQLPAKVSRVIGLSTQTGRGSALAGDLK
ncbi:MAG: hypothetical protein OXF60_08320 [Gammaproteobacteria bacterium]|nr:hypothetical protein [Gammaproteobacteria bacterium]